MSSNLQSYKIQKYLNKLQSVSQDHPSYQLYLSKYMYWLEGGVNWRPLTTDDIIKINTNSTYKYNDIEYKYCGINGSGGKLFTTNKSCKGFGIEKITLNPYLQLSKWEIQI